MANAVQAPAARRQAQYPARLREPAERQQRTAREIALMINGRPLLVDLPHIRRRRRPPAASGPVSAPKLQFMIANRKCRGSAKQLSLYPRGARRRRRQGRWDVPHPRRRRRQDPCPTCTPEPEENPALGWRAHSAWASTRPRPDAQPEIRALLQAARGRELRVMFSEWSRNLPPNSMKAKGMIRARS